MAKLGVERTAVAATMVFGVSPILGVAAAVSTDGPLSGVALALRAAACGLAAVVVVRLIARRLPEGLDGLARQAPKKCALWLLLALVATLQIARVSVFMVDPAARWASAFPPSEEAARHTCLSAYVYAAELHRRGDDAAVYQRATYRDPTAQTDIGNLAPYLGDAFLYPAPFLVVARGLLAVSPDFLVIRSVWFVLNILVFMAGALALAAWIGGRTGLRVGFLLPAALMAIPTLLNFQFGQVHLVTLVGATLAMALFATRYDKLGGLLLGAAILVKVFPAILLLYLAFQRRWRPVIATIAMLVVLTATSMAILGTELFTHYVYRAVDIGMGAGIPSTSVTALANDIGIFRVAEKLAFLGVVQQGNGLGSALLWAYTAVLGVMAWCAAKPRGRQAASRHERALIWLGLLALASLRAPVAPSAYIATSGIWILSLLAARVGPRRLSLMVAAGAAWLLLQGLPGAPSPKLLIMLSFLPQLVFVGVAMVAIFILSQARSETASLGLNQSV